MLSAITPVQVKEVIRLVEQWSDARKARADEGQKQFPDEIIHDPERRKLTDYLYALSDEGRGELIALMLLGRGDFDHSYESALATQSKYTSAAAWLFHQGGRGFKRGDKPQFQLAPSEALGSPRRRAAGMIPGWHRYAEVGPPQTPSRQYSEWS